MPLTELTGPLGRKRAAHLLRRATFGATNDQITQFESMTAAQAVATLFHQALPLPGPPLDLQTGLEWMTTGRTDANSEEGTLETYFLSWHIGQMMSVGISPADSLAYSAREKIVWFLHTHFTTIKSKVASTRALYFQNLLFRHFALDGMDAAPELNFKELTVKISVDNAMLRLLDGELNVAGNPNENYARELLELYSIGRGLEGTFPDGLEQGDYFVYTEQDVQAAARVLSGWQFDEDFANLDVDTGLPRGTVRGSTLNAGSHDNNPKQFSSRFNNAVITPDPLLLNGGNATEASGLDEIAQLIDLIYSKPETARHICWKVYRFFAYAPHDRYEPGSAVAAIDDAVITSLAETFINSGYKLLPVIEDLLTSEYFYDHYTVDLPFDNFGGLIKSPLDLVTGTLRAFDFAIPDMTTDLARYYDITGEMLATVNALGMPFYEPYDVAGYDAYHQWPIYHRSWITPNTLTRRYEFISQVFNTSDPGMLAIDPLVYVTNNFNAIGGNANELIIAVAQALLPVANNLTFDDANDDNSTLSLNRLNYFKARFMQGFDDAYWTNRWNRNAPDLNVQLAFLFNAMLQSPEYQLA